MEVGLTGIHRSRQAALGVLVLLVLLGVGCGGGSSDGQAGTTTPGVPSNPGPGGPSPGGLTPNPGPQVALLVCSGHSPLAPNYLATTAGPQLATAIQGGGYGLETTYFVDNAGGGATGGYAQLVAKLEQIRDDWIVGRSNPTRVVLVGHSHGCVRTHAAVRAVPDCPIRLLVDLDGSSVGWSLLTHGGENGSLGGAPEGAYNVNATITCPAYPNVPSAPPPFDLEDIVFANVQEAYEVRSGDVILDPLNLPQLIEYDERWNARIDGTTTGLTCVYSGTNHSEVAVAGGTTLAAVQAWILTRLAGG